MARVLGLWVSHLIPALDNHEVRCSLFVKSLPCIYTYSIQEQQNTAENSSRPRWVLFLFICLEFSNMFDSFGYLEQWEWNEDNQTFIVHCNNLYATFWTSIVRWMSQGLEWWWRSDKFFHLMAKLWHPYKEGNRWIMRCVETSQNFILYVNNFMMVCTGNTRKPRGMLMKSSSASRHSTQPLLLHLSARQG